MTKVSWKAGAMLSPLPPAMVSCGTVEKPNVLTVAWTGIVASDPAMTYVSIRKERYSYEIIKESGEFVINLPNLALLTAVDFCGVKSGKNVDKFKEMNLTAIACSEVSAPQIEEAPVSIECKVKSVTNYGSHDMFLAEIVAVNVDDKYLDKNGKLCLEKAGLLAYSHGTYFTLGRELGTFGFSVNKRRLAQIEKMQNVEVSVKQSKFIEKTEDEKAEKAEKTKKKYGKPLAEKRERPAGGDRRVAEKERKERRERDFDDKPRGERKFEDKPRGERGERRFDDKPRGERKFEDKPRGERGERKPRGFGDKPREDRGERAKRDFKPRGDRSFDDKPRGERSFGDKPRRSREDGERKPRGFGDKPREDRGERRFDDRPRSEKPAGGRKPMGGGARGGRPSGDRKPSGPRKSFRK